MQDTVDPNTDLPTMTTTNADIPEEADEMITSIESPQTFMPPPRIAARFYRPSTNRRKSSAASSRRNSISSNTSHQSTRSYRGGCQSNLIAQQLRRATILESRKARLADRAAHVEQVRLRAALAKTNSRSSTSEERALAAKQARDKHLAQVAASCAEEVRRAKKVAEDNRERRAAEEQRYRQEIEDKHAEAEKRRLEYKRNLRRPRTTSVPSSEGKKPTVHAIAKMSESDAASRIQSVWRMRQRRKTVESFSSLGLSIDRIHDTSFDDVSTLLADERLLSATANLLRMFNFSGNDKNSTDQTAIRTFLSAYLILGHPTEVLSKDGDQEQDLIQKAKDLVMTFESSLSDLTAYNRFSPRPTQIETLLMSHGAFVAAFADWKARDSSALIETMVTSFVNLDAIWQSVKDDTSGEVANDYREGIRDNQVILLSKIRKLAGPEKANFLIKKAIRESRRTRTRRRPLGDVRPRVALDSPTALELPDSPFDNPVQLNVTSRLDSLRDEGTNTQATANSAVTSQSQTQWLQSRTARPQESGASSLSRLFSVMPTNRTLTHELAIDKEYRINSTPHSNLQNAMNRTLCDAMQRGFEDGDGAKWTVAMAENIRSRLLRLLRPGNSMHTLISETLDPDFVQTQAMQGLFSYEKFFNFMSSILPKLCAPFRDEQVRSLAQELGQSGTIPEMIEKLFKLLHVIDLLSLDYSNFLLANAAPTLIKEAAGYEQRMFAQDLESGAITLQRTKRWWSNAAVNILTEATGDRRDPSNRPTPQKIYFRGLVDLAMATSPLQQIDVPETLQLDVERLTKFRRNTLRITTIGAILLSAKNMLKRDVRSSWKPEANRMWDILQDGYLKDETMPSKILSILESSHPMPPATRSQLSGAVQRFLDQAQAGRLTDPVMKVVYQRLKMHVLTRVSASSSGERVRAASTASEGLASFGLPEFSSHVGDIVDGLGRVGDVDRRAHSVWYEEVQREVEAMGADDSGAR